MNNEEFIHEINSDFNKVKSLSEQLSSEIFGLTSKYCMTDENLYYVLINGRKAVEHLYGSLSIAQNTGVVNATYLKNGPYQQYYQGTQNMQGGNQMAYESSQQFYPPNNAKPIIFSRQRSSSSQSHLHERWEDIEPTPLNEFSMSVPNSVVNCNHDHSRGPSPVNGDEPMSMNEFDDVKVNTEQAKVNAAGDSVKVTDCESKVSSIKPDSIKPKAFADVVKQPTQKLSTQDNTKKSETLPKQTIKPFIKQNDSGVWNLQTKPGMIADFIHNNIDELQFEVTNIDELMNIKFYFRDPSEINMHGLWQYNRKYFLSEDGRVFIYTKKRELVHLKQNGKEITYKLA